MLIGEIRDRETAAIALQASLTGHLVFATLHTNNACSSITRLTDLGVDSAKLAGALKGIVAQRLIRRLCPACKLVANAGVPRRLVGSIPENSMIYIPAGCGECAMTGYSGRIAITEVLVTTPELERAIAGNEPPDRLLAAARASGTRSLGAAAPRSWWRETPAPRSWCASSSPRAPARIHASPARAMIYRSTSSTRDERRSP